MNKTSHAYPVYRSGFTIVELLIVIVVIAIIAAISIVGYSGIQQRARTSALAAEMSQVQKTIQVEALKSGGQAVSVKTPLVYLTKLGTSQLAAPLEIAQELSLYVVFDTANNAPSNPGWNRIANFSPHLDTSKGFAIRTNAAGSNSMHGFYATSAQSNLSINFANILNTTGRHVGWITAKVGAITVSFDNSTPTSQTLTTHTGWSFSELALSASPAASGVAAIAFPEYHDEATRTEILKWLDREYSIDYYN